MASAKAPNTLTYGLITGLVTIIAIYILYLGGVNTFLSGAASLVYVFMIIMAVVAALTKKKENGGYLEFRQAVQTVFTVFAIALAMLVVFNWVLMNFMDLNFKAAVAQETLRRTEEMLQKFKMTDDQIDKVMDEARHSDQFTLGKSLLGLMIWYIVAFLIALLIAAIMKKKKPEFTEGSL